MANYGAASERLSPAGLAGRRIDRHAISAATRDPRFKPVKAGELPHLRYSVDVLSPPGRRRRRALIRMFWSHC